MAQVLASSTARPVVAAPSRATIQRPAARSANVPARAVSISNGSKDSQMMVWSPINNKFFETFSYLPPLSENEIARQVDYIVNNGFIPSLEFAESDQAYADTSMTMLGQPGYYDNRYWTMWKLPMFGCNDPSQVLGEIKNCTQCFPNAYIRLVAFDNVRQVQCAGFLVHRPRGANDYLDPDQRSVN